MTLPPFSRPSSVLTVRRVGLYDRICPQHSFPSDVLTCDFFFFFFFLSVQTAHPRIPPGYPVHTRAINRFVHTFRPMCSEAIRVFLLFNSTDISLDEDVLSFYSYFSRRCPVLLPNYFIYLIYYLFFSHHILHILVLFSLSKSTLVFRVIIFTFRSLLNFSSVVFINFFTLYYIYTIIILINKCSNYKIETNGINYNFFFFYSNLLSVYLNRIIIIIIINKKIKKIHVIFALI